MGVYGAAALLWVHLLKFVPLSFAYPFAALSFVFVPLISIWFFDERVSSVYWIGTAFILLGVCLTVLR